jgi:hypothetical protein
MGVGGQCHDLVTLPQRKTRYPLYRRLGKPQSQSEWVQKITPLQRFNPQIIQPIVRHYTK